MNVKSKLKKKSVKVNIENFGLQKITFVIFVDKNYWSYEKEEEEIRFRNRYIQYYSSS